MEDNASNLLIRLVQKEDHLALIRQLLRQGGNPNYQTTSGLAPLHIAAKTQDDAEVIGELITAGADVNLNTHLSYTALHYAVSYRNVDSVYLLVQYGACINAKTFLDETPLHFAVKTIRNDGEDVLDPDVSIINFLTNQKGININAKDVFGNTPLMVAVQDVQEEIVDLLLECHADPNIPNNFSESPLHAAFGMEPNFIQISLLQKGASLYSRDQNGLTPLEIFFEKNSSMTLDDSEDSVIRINLLKYIALDYRTSDLKQKLRCYSELCQYFRDCCDEVDRMKNDFISAKITTHDFLCGRFNEMEYKSPLLEIYLPVIERLIKDDYPEFSVLALYKIPDDSLYSLLQMAVNSKKCVKSNRELKLFADVISISRDTLFISKYLEKDDILSLIVAFSDVANPQ